MSEDKEPFSPQKLYARLRTHYPPLEDHAYFLLTDGSGHQNGVWGGSCMLLAPRFGLYRCAEVGGTCGSVERAEFEALLLGLQLIQDHREGSKSLTHESLRIPKVYWVSDRQSLVLAVMRDKDDDNKPPYSRKSTPDLWRRFSFYEERMKITPTQSSPKETEWFKHVDIRSSEMFQLIKSAWVTWNEDDSSVSNGLSRLWQDSDVLADFNPNAHETQILEWESQNICKFGPKVAEIVRMLAIATLTQTASCKTYDGYYLPNLPK